jgi:Sulfotransferase family
VEAEAAAGFPPRPKVIYVMGAGHSGSTIVGVALGNCPGVFYAGEVEEWVVNAGIPGFGGSERTQFWGQVREQVKGAEALFGGEANRCIERSSSLFRLDRWRSRRRLRPTYLRVARDLYRAIARVSQSECIVDSSHFPLRARELKRFDGIDLHLLFLVREPHSLVGSYLKQVNRQDVAERRLRLLTTNLDLWLTYLVSTVVFLRHRRDRRIFLRYEDFLADPGRVVRQVLAPAGVAGQLPDLAKLEIGVPLQGNNRLVRSEVVALKTGTRHPPRRSRLTALLLAPWAAVFSRLRPRAEAGARMPAGDAEQPRAVT